MKHNNNKDIPPYYKSLKIYYKDNKGMDKEDIAWLAIDDNLDYIWTLVDDNSTIIDDDKVEYWEEI